MHASWSARHFSLANASDDRPEDLPHLLRRLADHIEAQGIDPMNLLEVTVTSEMTEDGPWWSCTVYGHRMRTRSLPNHPRS
jgi:hypothetical protein